MSIICYHRQRLRILRMEGRPIELRPCRIALVESVEIGPENGGSMVVEHVVYQVGRVAKRNVVFVNENELVESVLQQGDGLPGEVAMFPGRNGVAVQLHLGEGYIPLPLQHIHDGVVAEVSIVHYLDRQSASQPSQHLHIE